ncbi:MAG: hypothetical protein ACYDBQ_04835 [Thermoplasmatota archaeon]
MFGPVRLYRVAVPAGLAVLMLTGLFATGTYAGPSITSDGCGTSGFRPAECGAPPECLDASHWVTVPTVGLGCPAVGGLWWVEASDGTYWVTHGGDPKPSQPAAQPAMNANGGGAGSYQEPPTPAFPGSLLDPGQNAYAESAPPVHCTNAFDYRVVPVYVYASDAIHHSPPIYNHYNMGGNFQEVLQHRAELIREIQTSVKEINWWVFENAMVYGQNRTLKVQCDNHNQIVVRSAVLSTPYCKTNFGTVMGDLRRQGYTDPRAKYWIYFEENGKWDVPFSTGTPAVYSCGPPGQAFAAGQGNACNVGPGGDLPNAGNCGNGGIAGYAINWGWNKTNSAAAGQGAFFGDVQIWLHEGSHTFNLVSNSAPHSSGAAHCNDGYDVMCYADGGPTQCPGSHGTRCSTTCTTADTNGNIIFSYDCGGDDYFNPSLSIPASNYLATHWNVGNPMFRYFAVGRPTQCADGIDNNGDGLIDSQDLGCASARDDLEADPCPVPAIGLLGGNVCTGVSASLTCSHPANFSPAIAQLWHQVCGAQTVFWGRPSVPLPVTVPVGGVTTVTLP